MSAQARTPPVVACPQCGAEHAWDTRNRFRPFCGERCKLIDLGKWANEEYRVGLPDAEEARSQDYQA
jgi:endogenous inhibitor of DNA gyrase (YacG/DUF329 family)